MTQVFLSHSTIDAEFALKLATDLRAAGIPVWKAPESILVGEEWVDAIQRGITTSSHMLLLMSKAAVESKWVNFEFNAALTLEKEGKMRIIPIDYQPCSPPLFWKMFQHVSGIRGDYDSAVSKIRVRLQEQPAHPPTPTDETTTLYVMVQSNVTGHEGKDVNYAGQPSEPPSHAEIVAAAEADDDTPDWLKSEPAAAEADDDLPDWLKSEPAAIVKPAAPIRPILDILPPPFKWADIPAGQVTLEDDMGMHYVEAFQMAKYAVTNAQYQVFVDAEDGYRNVEWWHYSKSAGEWRGEHEQPGDPAFGGEANHPRVNVSWFDAVAFCRWLSKRAGQKIMLPTEQQWQWAAQGDDGRTYAWGDEEPNERLANWGRRFGQTTPVDSYPLQAERSHYGLFNMTGNVWEWCVTHLENGGDHINRDVEARVAKGGSWENAGPKFFYLTERAMVSPRGKASGLSFRCARSYSP